MKLWQKVFLWSFVFMVAAIDIMLLFTLSRNFRTTVDQEINRVAQRTLSYKESLQNRMLYQRLESGKLRLPSDQVEEEIAGILTSQEDAKDSLIVCRMDGTKVAAVDAEAEEILPEDFQTKVQEGGESEMYSLILDEGEKSYLLTGTTITLESENYVLYLISDVTELYRQLDGQIRLGQLTGLLFATLTGVALMILSIRLMRPLGKINVSIGVIADGDYSLRLPAYRSPEFRELAENVNRMSDAIEKNVAKVQGLADERQQFVDNFAHEMKTPLTSILGFGDLIRIQKEMPDAKREQYAGIIVEQTKRLQSLSAKMLQLSSLNHQTLDWQETEVNQLFFDVYKTVIPLMTTRRIHLRIEPTPGKLCVDKDLFELLLSNLLDNAGKASQKGDTVRLWADRRDDAWYFFVKDEGVGMEEKELAHIQEPFYMVDKSRSRKNGGVGLGLSLCARIVELHQAQFHIDSAPGKGTLVTVAIRDGGQTGGAAAPGGGEDA